MGRPLRSTPGGLVYHVLNRASGRATLFENADDFALFERALEDAHECAPVRVLAYCVMPNHWRLLLSPDSRPGWRGWKEAVEHGRDP